MLGFLSGKSVKSEDTFISKMSHDLRTPLSAVKWYAEMLLDGDAGELNEEQKKHLVVIRDNNQKAIDLVNSFNKTS